MKRKFKVIIYFISWILLAIIAAILNFLNINFAKTPYVAGAALIVFLGIIQGSVLEYPVQTIACLIVGGWRREVPKAPSFSSTMILNYNILAYSKEDIDSCMEMMYKAYMGNLSSNISAVLVSATNDDKLKEYELLQRNYYRNKIYKVLHKEGKTFARGDYSSIDKSRLQNVWNKYKDLNSDEFIRTKLNKVCKRYLREFMVIHRVRRVLRKCGQYQDLILLSSGDKCAYTYCDTNYYDRNARFFDEPLFYDSDDVRNIYDRNFDYTLVLDSDTGLPNSAAYELLKIAEEHPDRGIIQPAIKMKWLAIPQGTGTVTLPIPFHYVTSLFHNIGRKRQF